MKVSSKTTKIWTKTLKWQKKIFKWKDTKNNKFLFSNEAEKVWTQLNDANDRMKEKKCYI